MLTDLTRLGDRSDWAAHIPDPGGLDARDAVGLLTDLHRIEQAVAERKLALCAHLLALRQAAEQHGSVDSDAVDLSAGAFSSTAWEETEAEIGIALVMNRHGSAAMLDLAVVLRDRLPRVREELARGRIDVHRARQIDRGTANVADEYVDRVERAVIAAAVPPAGSEKVPATGRRLTDTIGRIIQRIDPDGARRRRERKHHDRYVGIGPDTDGAVALYGQLAAEDGVFLTGRLREMAIEVCADDPRTLDARRADALMALAQGHTRLRCRCADPECDNRPGDSGSDAPAVTGYGWSPAGDTTARRPLVHLIMTASAYRDETDDPAFLDGHGVIDADHARRIAAGGRVRELQVPEDLRSPGTGRPASALRYRPGGVLDTWVRAWAGRCRWPHCDAASWRCDLDHARPFDHADPAAGGPTVAAGLQPYCRNHHRLKHSGRWSIRRAGPQITMTTPTGARLQIPAADVAAALGYDDTVVGGLDDRLCTDTSAAGIGDPAADRAQGRRRRDRAENRRARVRSDRRANRADRRKTATAAGDPWASPPPGPRPSIPF